MQCVVTGMLKACTGMLDMTFREDELRIRKKRGSLVFNVMRKIALALFKQDDTKTAVWREKRRWQE